eukprot:TRINITY_DN620_c2_g1_i1.p2 TRINITY_DN620_c2_g1~~TRINITY_DN620_c2_g1_i1.p2  ORF type:complete len:106 (-),score=22.15 TRINITY_DN620_c2_g1_i1:617-934(-)
MTTRTWKEETGGGEDENWVLAMPVLDHLFFHQFLEQIDIGVETGHLFLGESLLWKEMSEDEDETGERGKGKGERGKEMRKKKGVWKNVEKEGESLHVRPALSMIS